MDRCIEIEQLRGIMGTRPIKNAEAKTDFFKGVEGIDVELIDSSVNPYKAMYVVATSTWGSKINKWNDTSVDGRIMVIQSILNGDTLPLPLEVPSFTFGITGLSRSAFDQIVRARIGVVYGAVGMRDNNWVDCDFRIPNGLYKFPELVEKFKIECINIKTLYADIVNTGKGSWQVARSVLPLSVCYRFSMSINYAALKNMLSKRLMFCEQEDTVATAWLLQKCVSDKFALLGAYLRPVCDYAKRCVYHKAYSMSEAFGCLFSGCGRWKDEYKFAEFNESCSDASIISAQLKIDIPNSATWDKIIDRAINADRKYFEEN